MKTNKSTRTPAQGKRKLNSPRLTFCQKRIYYMLILTLFVPGVRTMRHPYKYLSVIPEQMIPFACAFMTFNIFPLPS